MRTGIGLRVQANFTVPPVAVPLGRTTAIGDRPALTFFLGVVFREVRHRGFTGLGTSDRSTRDITGSLVGMNVGLIPAVRWVNALGR